MFLEMVKSLPSIITIIIIAILFGVFNGLSSGFAKVHKNIFILYAMAPLFLY